MVKQLIKKNQNYDETQEKQEQKNPKSSGWEN